MMTSKFDPEKFSEAESLLWSYGVTLAREIDLEAIAGALGITVRRRKLEGSDARLVAVRDSGIITVNSDTHPKRQRFSIGHEIGHWVYDRHEGGLISCSKEDVEVANQTAKSREAKANIFSSDLLLPPYLVGPIVAGRAPSIDLALELASKFDTSRTAAAIRVVRQSKKPAAVVVMGHVGRAWYLQNVPWPSDIYLRKEVHHDTQAMDLLYAGAKDTKTRCQKEQGDRWLLGRNSFRIAVCTQSIKIDNEKIMTVIQICD